MTSKAPSEPELAGAAADPESASPAGRGPASAGAAAAPVWPYRLQSIVAQWHQWLLRPRVRLSATGVLLLLIGGLLMANSVWTLPLVVIGGVMVVIAWIGRRLDGGFTVEWGQTGTQLAFRAEIKAAPAPPVTQAPTGSRELTPGQLAAPEAAGAIEGEAHTVEIDVGELRALLAAVENAGAELASTDGSMPATRSLRVAYDGARRSEH